MRSFVVHIKRVSLATVLLASMFGVQFAHATVGETDAGITISNTATVSYTVGAVSQPDVASNVATFTVDRRVDFTVTEVSGGTTSVYPGQLSATTAAVVTFRVSNTGNGTEGFNLTAANMASGTASPFSGGAADSFDVSNFIVRVDVNNNGVLDAADNVAYLDNIPRDQSRLVFVLADIPTALANLSRANVRLTARAAVTGSLGVTLETESATNSVGGVADVVIADAARDNSEQAQDQYEIATATLTATKTSVVFNDPLNGTTNPKAIPGAEVTYTITIANATTTAATAVKVVDTIPITTTYVAGTLTLDGVSIPDVGNTTGAPVTGINTVTSAFTVTNAAPKVVTFRVKIK